MGIPYDSEEAPLFLTEMKKAYGAYAYESYNDDLDGREVVRECIS